MPLKDEKIIAKLKKITATKVLLIDCFIYLFNYLINNN
jgi:hypothetical protein